MIEFPSTARHCVVINLKYLGDSIWMLPFMENFKKNHPDVRLSVVVNEGTEAFFYGCQAVDEVIPFPRKRAKSGLKGIATFIAFIRKIRKMRPDITIDLTDADRPALLSFFSGAKMRIGYNNENKWRNRLSTHHVDTKIYSKHMVDYHLDVLRKLGMAIGDTAINICVADRHVKSLKEKVPSVFAETGKKRIVVHPGARGSLRQWAPENFAYLCDELSDVARIFLISGPGEGPILEKIISHMKTRPEICTDSLDLFECAALCGISDMFIGNDSGPIHIASAKTFCVGIYGPTLPDIIYPWTEKRLIIDPGALHCRPCKQEKCLNAEFQACLVRIKPAEVLAKVRQVLDSL